ncbi:MAG TPA: hypothetical protein VFW09_11160 [Solirubrobacteraceae bacterium]|nr:hypothetical protein [Solirubrobacteraceae bacterium]
MPTAPGTPATPTAPGATAPPTAPATTAGPGTPELVSALRAELAMRATAEAGLRARVVDAETRLSARTIASQRTAETLREIRAELERLAELVAGERTRREAAEEHVAALERELHELRAQREPADAEEAQREIGALRDSLAQLRAPAPDAEHAAASPTDADPVRSERLADALARLRANTQPLEQPAAPAVPATLAGAFRTLCRRDPALAGRLAISLLGMERIVHPRPIAFDLVLGPAAGCIQVTSSETGTEVVAETTARPPEQVAFHVVGGPDRLARLLVAGRLRRRLGFGVARVRGDRDGLAALEALLSLPLDLPALVEGGMLSDSTTMLSLVAAIVRPEWTRGAYFALSHRDGDAPASYLRFSGGRRPEVTATEPAGPIATAISCSGQDLASLLAGAIGPGAAGVEVRGDAAPLTQLQGWIKRAQSG